MQLKNFEEGDISWSVPAGSGRVSTRVYYCKGFRVIVLTFLVNARVVAVRTARNVILHATAILSSVYACRRRHSPNTRLKAEMNKSRKLPAAKGIKSAAMRCEARGLL